MNFAWNFTNDNNRDVVFWLFSGISSKITTFIYSYPCC